MRLRAGSSTASIALALGLALAPAAVARSDVVRAGPARFEVLTPTLIRLEFAQDRRFDDAPTMTTAGERRPAPPRFTVRRGDGG